LGQPKPPYGRDDITVLDHYDVGSPMEGDHKVIEHLLESGADLSLPRHTIHFLYFPSSETADGAAESLSQAGYSANSCERLELGRPNEWPVIAEKTDVVNEAAMERERIFLDAFAEALGGEYDGWETSLD
jgi:regulator of RNase E activity RraB